MARVRQRDTAPERVVRRALSSSGIHYRVCPKSLPGRPDLANRSRRWAIFVHGCFWHGHESCVLARLPRTNTTFWTEKIKANRIRDQKKEAALVSLGFRVYTIWQCQLRDSIHLRELVSALKEPR